MEINWKDFEKIEMRIGTILTAENFEEVRNPAYKMTIDFGEFEFEKPPLKSPNYINPKNSSENKSLQ